MRPGCSRSCPTSRSRPACAYYSQSAANFYYDPVADIAIYPGPVGIAGLQLARPAPVGLRRDHRRPEGRTAARTLDHRPQGRAVRAAIVMAPGRPGLARHRPAARDDAAARRVDQLLRSRAHGPLGPDCTWIAIAALAGGCGGGADTSAPSAAAPAPAPASAPAPAAPAPACARHPRQRLAPAPAPHLRPAPRACTCSRGAASAWPARSSARGNLPGTYGTHYIYPSVTQRRLLPRQGHEPGAPAVPLGTPAADALAGRSTPPNCRA